MTSINISIKKEAYDFLSRFKTENKSFSDVILGFKDEKNEKSAKSLLRFAGCLKDLDIDWEEKERRMKEFRDSFEKRVKETAEYMEKSRK